MKFYSHPSQKINQEYFRKIKLENGFVKKIRLTLDKVNYHFIGLMSFTDCPRCSTQGLVIPLVKEENRYVCSMCGSVYQNEEN